MNKPDVFASDATSGRGSPPASADALTAPTPPKQWTHPVPQGIEVPAKLAVKPVTAPMKTAPVVQAIPPAQPVRVAPIVSAVPAAQPARVAPIVQMAPTPQPVRAAPVVPAAPAAQSAILGSTAGPLETNPKRAATPTPKTSATPLRSARRWPPAYAPAPIESDKGRPGVILFEDEPASKPAAQPAATGGLRRIVPEDLNRQVRAVCGKQARDVLVESQHDGSVLVKVKVANAAVERQLLSKILTIPEMSAPNVHLATTIGPN
jgi:hypothetical protein